MKENNDSRFWQVTSVIVLGAGVLLAIVIWLSVMSTLNADVKLRSAAAGQQSTNKATFDTMWKILQSQAGIVDKYKKDFQEIWPALIAGRYSSGGGQMTQWIQERNPNFDSSLYKQLMSSIEAQRNRFLTEQKYLLKIKEQHDNLRNSVFSGWALTKFGNPKELEVTIVTSESTESSFKSGQENDIQLFK